MAEGEHTDGKTVLIAVDSSDLSKAAFLWYVRHLHRPGNKIVCVHAIESPNLSDESWEITGYGRDRMSAPTQHDVNESWDITGYGKDRAHALKKRWEQVQEDDKHLTRYFNTLLDEHDLKSQLQLIEGVPGEAIVKAANENKADFVIIGPRGQGKSRRVLGRVSRYVLHHAHCPVCINC